MDLATIPSPVDEETHQRGRQICAQNTGMPDTHSVMDEAESRGIGAEKTPSTKEESLSRAEIHTDTEEDPCSAEESLSRAEVDTNTKRDPCSSIEQAQITDYNEATRVSYPAEQTGRGEVWTLEKLKEELPFFKKMLPMWFAFVIYTMVDAAGSSFFFGQMSNLDDLIGNSAVYFAGFTSFTASVVSFLYEKVIAPKKWRHATLVNIGSAVTCSQLCCFAAWLVEVYRLKSVKRKGLENDNATTVSMSIFLLVPQFFLLGIMQGLLRTGLVDFFHDQINYDDKLMKRYGEYISAFVLGVIRLLTTLNILVPFFVSKKSWFGDNINTSRLDLYFFVLTLCSLVNIGYYLCVARYYATSRSPNAIGEEQQEQSA
ncbi:protein NRT1/ PTR FAMILY 5.10-like [Rosa chinensis]|nr:protein NRT1/ PTR FAMILY 5.10-like [Rosa chinensis]